MSWTWHLILIFYFSYIVRNPWVFESILLMLTMSSLILVRRLLWYSHGRYKYTRGSIAQYKLNNCYGIGICHYFVRDYGIRVKYLRDYGIWVPYSSYSPYYIHAFYFIRNFFIRNLGYFVQNLKKLLGLSRRAKKLNKKLFKKLTLKWPFPSQIWGLCTHRKEAFSLSMYLFSTFSNRKTRYCLEGVMQMRIILIPGLPPIISPISN